MFFQILFRIGLNICIRNNCYNDCINRLNFKVMKKFIVLTLAVLTFGIVAANADNNRIIAKNNLPQKSQQFIDQYFGDMKISYVKEERDFIEKSYEVMFADGTKVEFTRSGEWKEIDCRQSSVPTPVIPAKITKYIKDNYPDVKVMQIERDRRDYEVKLSNRLELTFDSKFNIIDIDD